MNVEIEEKRFALLMAVRDSEYVKKMYGGYYNVFVSAFGDEGERWEMFRVVDGEFPDYNELHKFDGFVISGSPNDAYGNDSWILKLCLLLRTICAMHKKVLGICFGHQVLSRALGGKVGKASTGWDIGVRKVKMVKAPPRCKLFSGLDEIPPSASILEIHQDEVWEAPDEAEVIGYSEKTRVEMFTIGEHIMGLQGHPEYSKDILSNIIDRLLNNNIISSNLAMEARERLAECGPDRQFWLEICKSFLKGSHGATAAVAA